MSEDHEFPIFPVLEHYGWELPEPRSGWQTVKCGVHEERRGSCRVNNVLGAVNCMACGFKGDTIKVIQHYEGCGYREAVAIAEGILGGSDAGVQRKRRTGDSVLEGSRAHRGSRGYVPPRLRRGTDAG